MEARFEDDALLFRALGDPNRLRILDGLRRGECCACLLLEELDIAQSTLSHHMKILCGSGLVTSRQAGRWTHYSLSAAGCDRARAALAGLVPPPAPDQAPASLRACDGRAERECV